ncbi:spore germination protein [Clostridium lundense]|uniref:spore germination protein n=1 Tax=Clostridium lundense TaxID=319475 RepID=UPI000481ACD4|nr:spore germination protein [Clostridium lundense]
MSEYVKFIKDKLDKSADVKYREIHIGCGIVHVVFIDDLCDSKFISEYIVSPITINRNFIFSMDNIKLQVLEANSVGDIKDFNSALMHLMSGDVLIILEGSNEVIYCEAKGFNKRSITTPLTETVIKGPREGFNESFSDNVSLIRRKIKNPDLKLENFTLGKKSNTIVVMMYIENVAQTDLVERIRNKLKDMQLEFILDINYIEEQFKEKGTFFDTIGYSEKPDIVASKILEGRVAIIVDGTPFVITMPYFFIENFQMADDYYINKHYSNAARILREVSFLVSLLLPGLYIAITTYHFSLIPSVFVFRLAVSRAGVPFPTVIEIYLMMFFFQILREAGVRLPQPVGQAMSIVGALILGDAAVGAGLTSQISIIVVALSSICSFLVPKLYPVISIWSPLIILFGSLLGLPGFYIIMLTFVAHVASLESVGYSYLYPMGTTKKFKFRDVLFRGNLKDISKNIGEDESNEKDKA